MAEPFYKRFNIEVGLKEARRRFIERIRTLTWSLISNAYTSERKDMNALLQAVNFHLGERHQSVHFPSDLMDQWDAFVGDDFSTGVFLRLTVQAK